MIKNLTFIIATAASALALLLIVSAAAGADARYVRVDHFPEYAATCPTYAARSYECDKSAGCNTRGSSCAVNCGASSFRRGECSNATLGTADLCMLDSQDAGAMSTWCTYKCSSITNPIDCFGLSSGNICYWYNGACRNSCSTLSDATACALNAATCGPYNDDPSVSGCPAKCEVFTDAYSCSNWALSGCTWNQKQKKCQFACNNAADNATLCARYPHCEIKYGQCNYKCSNITDKKECTDVNCMWALGKCTVQCSDSSISDDYNRTTSRAYCHDISPMCGGQDSCGPVKCSLAKSKWDCRIGIGGGCVWFGTGETVGQCTESCSSQWFNNPICTPIHGGQNTCYLKNDTGSSTLSCESNDCGNITEMNACFAYWSYCAWDVKTSTCKASCLTVSGIPAQDGMQSDCQQNGTSRGCAFYPFAGGDPNRGWCIATCSNYNKAACMLDSDCIWAKGACSTNCRFLLETSCKASPACAWYNDTLNKASCKIKCSVGDTETCKTSAFSGGDCVWVGGETCSCIRMCPTNAMNECPSPCVRSAKWGGMCMIPEGFSFSTDAACSSAGLSGAAIGGIVGGVVGFIVIAVIVGVVIMMVVGKKAASSAGAGGGGSGSGGGAAWGSQPGTAYQQQDVMLQHQELGNAAPQSEYTAQSEV